jgi:hypothetical protein
MSSSALDMEPLAGDVFAISVEVSGIDKGYASLIPNLSL